MVYVWPRKIQKHRFYGKYPKIKICWNSTFLKTNLNWTKDFWLKSLEYQFRGRDIYHFLEKSTWNQPIPQSNMENIDFGTVFTVTLQQWSLLKKNCDFCLPLNISDQIHRILCPKLLYVLRKCTKSSKIRPRGVVPLTNLFDNMWMDYSRGLHKVYFWSLL